MKPTIHALCGLPCSGKSTYARKIENERKAIIISPDEWMSTIFGPNHSSLVGFQYAENVSKIIRSTWETIIKLNIDVILDDGFPSKAFRDHLRQRAKEIGANFQLYYFSCSERVLLERLRKRNDNPRDCEIVISDSKFQKHKELFEAPTDDEEFILIAE